jgi:hypothetical protein
MTPDVKKSIENLYLVFADLPTPTEMPYCNCGDCLNKEQSEFLLRTPLREIPEKEIARYVWTAFATVGSAPDYQYLLPRIAELAVGATDEDGYGTLPLDQVWECPNHAEWETWEEKYKIALLHYVDTVCVAFSLVEMGDVAEWAYGFAFSFPMKDRLNSLLTNTSEAYRNLLTLQEEAEFHFNLDKEYHREGRFTQEMRDWLASPPVTTRLHEIRTQYWNPEWDNWEWQGRLPLPPG